jgi:hypothetical protein
LWFTVYDRGEGGVKKIKNFPAQPQKICGKKRNMRYRIVINDTPRCGIFQNFIFPVPVG